MFLLLLLCLAGSLAPSSSVIVCRMTRTETEEERVTCPDDYYCCANDQCCKLTFDIDKQTKDDRESFEHWVTDFCVRTVIVTLFMIILFAMGKSVQCIRRRYMAKYCSEESSLPKYKSLEKNISATNMTDFSKLIGTPFYHMPDEAESFRGTGNLPI